MGDFALQLTPPVFFRGDHINYMLKDCVNKKGFYMNKIVSLISKNQFSGIFKAILIALVVFVFILNNNCGIGFGQSGLLAITVQNFSWQGGSDTDCQWTAEIQNNGTLEEIYQMNITVELVLANGAGTHRQMFQDNQTLAPGSTIQWFDQLNTSALGGSTRGNISRIRVSMIEAYSSTFQLIHTETFDIGESSVLWHGGG